jgi:cell division protein FtsL
MKKGVLVFCAVLLPLILFFDVVQAARYAELQAEVNRLERLQSDWLEQNKRLITGITVLSFPGRIDALASDQFGLRRADPERTTTIEFARTGNGHG